MCHGRNDKPQMGCDFDKDHESNKQDDSSGGKALTWSMVVLFGTSLLVAVIDYYYQDMKKQRIKEDPGLIHSHSAYDLEYLVKPVIQSNPELVARISNSCNELCVKLFKFNPNIINHLTNISDDLYLDLIEIDSAVFQRVPSPTPDFCMKAIKKNSRVIKHISNPTQEMYQMALIKSMYEVKIIYSYSSSCNCDDEGCP
ncbi:Hypothetical protein MVR_LOCUS347 [uncultured virus]|nr:Hypothetical protein MVR_LOCUS347 [uncultured virus]